MLTKKERAAIAERLKSTEYITSSTLFKALTGEEKPSETSHVKSLCIICSVILGLCDTSNMLELPLDKDGEVIHIGDTLYDDDNDVKYEVAGYMMRGNSTEVILAAGAEPVYTKEPANNLTHKKPVTIASLVSEIRCILAKEDISEKLSEKIWTLTDLIEMSGDSDD